MLSLNANSASVTTQVQEMSFVSSYSSYADPGCEEDPRSCEPYTYDYLNDDYFFTFTATYDDATSILNISVSDGNGAQFTDGYSDGGYDPLGYYMGYSESEYVTIDVSDGQINSFTARNYYTADEDVTLSRSTTSTTRWFYDGNQLVRTYDVDEDYGMYLTSGTLSYDVINPSAIPLPAGIYLFLSGLVGLGLIRGRNA
tara:strand:- start:4072 stop:4668 length:597 start_codon:yes stop_codon:yes gene_type:complete